MMLKALGVNVSEEHIKAIEVIIPQIPAKLNEGAAFINQSVENFDQRITRMEKQQEHIIMLLDSLNQRFIMQTEQSNVNRSDRKPGTKRLNGPTT